MVVFLSFFVVLNSYNKNCGPLLNIKGSTYFSSILSKNSLPDCRNLKFAVGELKIQH